MEEGLGVQGFLRASFGFLLPHGSSNPLLSHSVLAARRKIAADLTLSTHAKNPPGVAHLLALVFFESIEEPIGAAISSRLFAKSQLYINWSAPPGSNVKAMANGADGYSPTFPDVYSAMYPLLRFICSISYFQSRILPIHTHIVEQTRITEDTRQF